MLHIQKLLKEKGLEKVVEDLNLIYKMHDDGRTLFKYRQIGAIWTEPATHECRGIILDRFNDFKVVSYPYDKFWNYGEGYAADMDWQSTKWYKKYDGSLMTLYYWKNEWHVQSSGTIEADVNVDLNNNSLVDLFKMSAAKMYGSYDKLLNLLDKNNCYIFEMMTPENIVVVQHTEYKIILHGVRNINTLEEIDIETIDNIFYAKSYDFNDIEEVKETANELPWTEEGYIGVDKYFNRIKIKGKSYVARHYSATGCSPYAIIDVIRENELDEYFVYFDTKQEHIRTMESNYNNLINNWNWVWDQRKESFKEMTRKEAAIIINENYHSYLKAFMFSMLSGKATDAKQWIDDNINNRDLYHLIKPLN